MNRSFARKGAQIALIVIVAFLCVLFACACESGVTISLDLKGEILPGASLEVESEIGGGASKVQLYSESDYALEITEGVAVAAVKEGKVLISEDANTGDKFTLRVTIADLFVEKEFTVQATKVERLDLFCADSVRAGDEISLFAQVFPANASDRSPTYRLISGEATLEGNRLKVSDRADGGEIVVKALLEGVASEEKRVAITTTQTRELYLTLSARRALPGSAIRIAAETEPAESDFPVTIEIEKGEESASLDGNVLTISDDAEMGAEIVLVARSGYCEEKQTVIVDYPDAQSVEAFGGGTVAPGETRSFDFELSPSDAQKSRVVIRIEEGREIIKEWDGGTTFSVKEDATVGEEIVFSLSASDDVYATLSYIVKEKEVSALSIRATGSTAYLKSGESLAFAHEITPVDYTGQITYRAIAGGDLVEINGNVVTVKADAEIGAVTVVAESADGMRSNEVSFTVSGRYVRRVYTNWESVTFSSEGENKRIWMVLPSVKNASCHTVLVPSDVVDLVIEGEYDGTERSAYKDLYFYFRNAAERHVTLWNFATIATQGFGGIVMDFGSSGKTEITLVGQNMIKADSPYLFDDSGENPNGIWDTDYSYVSQIEARRSGKGGYCGVNGGTAISGHTLRFTGEGVLLAAAGSGTNGTNGGKGADAEYSAKVKDYLSGAGGAGGHGGDSGSAIYAYSVIFASGTVTALSGNAGVGGKGGAAGSLDALIGKEVSAIAGVSGADGRDGVLYPAVRAKVIVGTNYTDSMGKVESRSARYEGSPAEMKSALSRFYGIDVKSDSLVGYSGYTMTAHASGSSPDLITQLNFLTYTLSRVQKNAWREVELRSGKKVTIYLCKEIAKSALWGAKTTIYGLTAKSNRVWFSTFAIDLRGVYYGGYFNIMLHEFVHVFHYNCSTAARTNFETQLESKNYGLAYSSSNSSNSRVYGVASGATEKNSCFLSAYSRKSVLEDAAETISLTATLSDRNPTMDEGTRIRQKFDLLVSAFGLEYETLSPFYTGKTLFAYSHLLD